MAAFEAAAMANQYGYPADVADVGADGDHGDELRRAMRASSAEYSNMADQREQGAIASALEASMQEHARREQQRLSQGAQNRAKEEQEMMKAIEASYRNQSAVDSAYRQDIDRAIAASTGRPLPGSSSSRRSAGAAGALGAGAAGRPGLSGSSSRPSSSASGGGYGVPSAMSAGARPLRDAQHPPDLSRPARSSGVTANGVASGAGGLGPPVARRSPVQEMPRAGVPPRQGAPSGTGVAAPVQFGQDVPRAGGPPRQAGSGATGVAAQVPSTRRTSGSSTGVGGPTSAVTASSLRRPAAAAGATGSGALGPGFSAAAPVRDKSAVSAQAPRPSDRLYRPSASGSSGVERGPSSTGAPVNRGPFPVPRHVAAAGARTPGSGPAPPPLDQRASAGPPAQAAAVREAMEADRKRREQDEVERRRKAAEHQAFIEVEQRRREQQETAERRRLSDAERERLQKERESAARRQREAAEAEAQAGERRRQSERQESERRRREAEEAARAKKEAEELAARKKEAEEAQRRLEVEKAEQERKDAEAAWRRREAQEAERERREAEIIEERRREAERSAQPAEDKPKSTDELVVALQGLRRRYREADPEGLTTCLQTLRTYINNLARNPHEAKFQRINTENAAFQKRVAGFEGARAVLIACGFEEQEDGTLAVPLTFVKSKGSKLFDALAKVDVILDQVKSSG